MKSHFCMHSFIWLSNILLDWFYVALTVVCFVCSLWFVAVSSWWSADDEVIPKVKTTDHFGWTELFMTTTASTGCLCTARFSIYLSICFPFSVSVCLSSYLSAVCLDPNNLQDKPLQFVLFMKFHSSQLLLFYIYIIYHLYFMRIPKYFLLHIDITLLEINSLKNKVKLKLDD